MKMLSLMFVLFVSASALAQTTEPASTTSSTTIPNAVISLMAEMSYPNALQQAKDSLKSNNSLHAENITIIGYSFTSTGTGSDRWTFGPATVILGAPQAGWPTCVYRIGTITGDASSFPDGINGVKVGDVKFNPETPTRGEGCDK